MKTRFVIDVEGKAEELEGCLEEALQNEIEELDLDADYSFDCHRVEEEPMTNGFNLAKHFNTNLPVYMAHSGERSEENPFSHISTFSLGVVVGFDPQNQPYIYNYHWTAEEADMAEEDWERMKRENQCLYIGWGFGDHEKSKLDCTEKGN